MLWWWGIAGFAVRLGQPWVAAGAAINTLAMIPVTLMVEAKMVRKAERAEAFRQYCRETSVWIPLPKFW
jgi:protein-S-isoprenylcysteine O-methyltransferase Ste14